MCPGVGGRADVAGGWYAVLHEGDIREGPGCSAAALGRLVQGSVIEVVAQCEVNGRMFVQFLKSFAKAEEALQSRREALGYSVSLTRTSSQMVCGWTAMKKKNGCVKLKHIEI